MIRFVCLFVLLASFSGICDAQVLTKSQRSQILKRYPKADTNSDGVLSNAEAIALGRFLRNRRGDTNRQPAEQGESVSDSPERGNGGKPDVAPKPTYEDVKYGPYQRNVFDLWVPKQAAKPVPLIVQIHGGGFVGGNKRQVRKSDIIQKALDRGVAFAAIQYRFRYPDNGDMTDPQRAPIQSILRDAARAVQFLRYKSNEYNIDPTRIACYGGSAGAGTSIWLAFHDDLADPTSDDPVLRQSSRIAAAGMLNGQFTYDIQQWDEQFASLGGDLEKTLGNQQPLRMHRFFGLNKEEYESEVGKAIRADVDMWSLVSPDDPPVFIRTDMADLKPKSRNIYYHHPRHAELIEQKCRECGVGVVCVLPKVRPQDAATLRSNPDLLLDFLCRHLKEIQ